MNNGHLQGFCLDILGAMDYRRAAVNQLGDVMQIANPKYSVGQKVEYLDRHQRKQVGMVRNVEAKWTLWGHSGDNANAEPYLHYTLSHPTYTNGQFHTNESVIIGLVGE